MNSKNTEAQVKAQVISQINDLRGDAEYYGFDYPTDANLETETVETLNEFLHELSVYILESVIAEIQFQQTQTTH